MCTPPCWVFPDETSALEQCRCRIRSGFVLTDDFPIFYRINKHMLETKSASSQRYWLLFCLTGSEKQQQQKHSTVRVLVECVFACVWWMHACMLVWVCVCASVCVHGLGREGSWVFASTALVVVWMAMYLTRYSEYLTGFHEPLCLPYGCHTDLKKCLVQSL